MNKIENQILLNQEAIMYALIRILHPQTCGEITVDKLKLARAENHLIKNYNDTLALLKEAAQ